MRRSSERRKAVLSDRMDMGLIAEYLRHEMMMALLERRRGHFKIKGRK